MIVHCFALYYIDWPLQSMSFIYRFRLSWNKFKSAITKSYAFKCIYSSLTNGHNDSHHKRERNCVFFCLILRILLHIWKCIVYKAQFIHFIDFATRPYFVLKTKVNLKLNVEIYDIWSDVCVCVWVSLLFSSDSLNEWLNEEKRH